MLGAHILDCTELSSICACITKQSLALPPSVTMIMVALHSRCESREHCSVLRKILCPVGCVQHEEVVADRRNILTICMKSNRYSQVAVFQSFNSRTCSAVHPTMHPATGPSMCTYQEEPNIQKAVVHGQCVLKSDSVQDQRQPSYRPRGRSTCPSMFSPLRQVRIRSPNSCKRSSATKPPAALSTRQIKMRNSSLRLVCIEIVSGPTHTRSTGLHLCHSRFLNDFGSFFNKCGANHFIQ